MDRLKTINCHAGKLPFYQGRNVLNWALINDEKEFGVTVHYVDEGIDTGDIIFQNSYPINESDSYHSLLERAYEGCAQTLYASIKQIQSNQVKLIPQKSIHAFGFYCIQRRPGDEILSWHQSSRNVFNCIRAICLPGPQARTFFGKVELRLNKVEFIPDAKTYIGIPGSVLHVAKDSFCVKTLETYVHVIEWSGENTPRIGDRLQ